MQNWQRVALGLLFFGLLFAAGRAIAGAWTLERPVELMADGTVIGTVVPVSFAEVEATLTWTGLPVENAGYCDSYSPPCTIQSNDIVFFRFVVAPTSQMLQRDALCATFTRSQAGGVTTSKGGWVREMPDDPSTINPTSSLISGFAECLKLDNPNPGPGDRTAILVSSFVLGEIENQLNNTPLQDITMHLFRVTGGGETPFVPVRIGPQVVRGQLFELEPGRGNTIDHWTFTIDKPLFLTFDFLSYENTGDVTEGGPPGQDQDVNTDGQIAYFKPKIYIFEGEPESLEASDALFVYDEDSSLFGLGDGSLVVDSAWPFDSYADPVLDPGSYVLTVGAWNSELEDESGSVIPAEAQAHIERRLNAGPFPTVFGPGGASSSHGSYQIIVGGGATLPEPGAHLMNGAALIALAAVSARHRRSR